MRNRNQFSILKFWSFKNSIPKFLLIYLFILYLDLSSIHRLLTVNLFRNFDWNTQKWYKTNRKGKYDLEIEAIATDAKLSLPDNKRPKRIDRRPDIHIQRPGGNRPTTNLNTPFAHVTSLSNQQYSSSNEAPSLDASTASKDKHIEIARVDSHARFNPASSAAASQFTPVYIRPRDPKSNPC